MCVINLIELMMFIEGIIVFPYGFTLLKCTINVRYV